jgi:hypothetical protein
METNWTRPEFKAYLLAYAANANYFESDEEKKVIHQMVSDASYDKIHKELSKDNDYQSIQKILYNIQKFNYSKEDLKALIQDINNMFNANDEHDILEDNMLLALKKLFL